MMKGEMQPSNVTGTLKRIRTARKEPPSMAASKLAKPRDANCSTGWAMKGTMPTRKAAQATIW